MEWNISLIIITSLLAISFIAGLIHAFLKGSEFLKSQFVYAVFTLAILLVGSFRFIEPEVKASISSPFLLVMIALLNAGILIWLLASWLGDFYKRNGF